jgi:nucleotide-binding universal stress UspA family protein
VLIAFDGSDHAGRALHQFVQLRLPGRQKVIVVMSDPDRDRARYYLDGAAAYLRAHGLEDIELDWSTTDIREHIADRYGDWADLVVAGAHSRRHILDFMLGSLTRQLLAKGDTAVLLGQ